MPQYGQRGVIVGPRDLVRQAKPAFTTKRCSTFLTIHTVGNHWVNRFLNRNPGFKKGITTGRNSRRVMAIVRVGHRSTAMTEGSREFWRESVLEG